MISSSIVFSFGPHKIKKKKSPISLSLFMSLAKLSEPHLVVGPEDPAPITILKLFLLNSLLILKIRSFFIKKLVSV